MTKTSKPIEIFKAGVHTSMQGEELAFAEADIAASAAAYDPALHEAPLVVGHPRHDAPAYGWVQSLTVVGDVLAARPRQVDASFAEMVGAGRFKKISASFYPPQAKANPVPGVYYLKHVAFLGAQPPAVKGLKPVEFAAGDDDGAVTVTVDFAEPQSLGWGLRAVKRVLARLRDRLVETDGLETADTVIPSWDLDDIDRAAVAAEAEVSPSPSPSPPPSFAEPAPSTSPGKEPPPVTITPAAGAAGADAREAALKAREAKLRADEAAFAEAKAKAEATTFVGDLVAQGRVPPVHRERLVAFMASLSDEAEAVSFAEGDKTVTASQRDTFKDFLAGLPKLIEFGEVAPAGAAADFAAGDDDAIVSAALAYQDQQARLGRPVTTAQAIGHVSKKGA